MEEGEKPLPALLPEVPEAAKAAFLPGVGVCLEQAGEPVLLLLLLLPWPALSVVVSTVAALEIALLTGETSKRRL